MLGKQRDLLAHRAATPTTPVPGQWLLDLPFSPSYIHIRRYTHFLGIPPAESSSDAIRRAAAEALLGKESEDPLDKAWRVVNGPNANEVDGGVKAVLRSPCAVVVTSEGEGKERELWLFEIRGPNASEGDRYHHEALEPLNVSQTHTEPFNITDLLSCEIHGHSASCLSRSDPVQSACEVMWDPGKRATSWKLFTWAVVEKLAWRDGRRLCMHDAEQALNASSVALRPLASQHLLLTVHSHETRLPITETHTKGSASILLLPMRTPAIPLSDFEPNAEQLNHLERSFTAALGSRWRDDQHRGRILSARNDRTAEGWTVYWVPIATATTDTTTNDTADGEHSLKPDPVKSIDRGVLVIWPTHLTLPLIPHHSPSFLRAKRKRSMSTLYDFPRHSDILDTASRLFDFMSSYKEPAPPPSEPIPAINHEEASLVDMPTPATGPTGTESTPKIPFDADPPTVSGNQDEGDIDDLFSSNPTSPLPVPPPEPIEHGTVDDFDDLFGGGDADERTGVEMDKDFDMDEPGPQEGGTAGSGDKYGRYAGSSNGNGNGVGEDQGGNLVTEDDFDFFDSPAEREAASAAAENGQAFIEDQPEPDEHKAESQVPGATGQELNQGPFTSSAEREDLGPSNDPGVYVDGDRPALVGSMSAKEHGMSAKTNLQRKNDENGPSPLSPSTDTSPTDDTARHTEMNERDRSMSLAVRAVPADIRPIHAQPISPASPFDIIPSDFSPLPSIQAPLLPHPVYTFPTPATTPETLRIDLVERLRQSKKQKGASDYASAWNVEDEPSEAEEEYDDSGAPPTPASVMITDDEEVKDESGKAGQKQSAGNGVDWNGISCLGAEWVWIKDDEAAINLMIRQWNEDWKPVGKDQAVEANTMPIPPPPNVIVLDGKLDLDRIATEIVSNRYFRKAVLSGSVIRPHTKQDMGYLGETGIPLSHLLDPAEQATSVLDENSIRDLDSCNVHAGFAGNVMRLSIAGIQYWRQLGLSPVGGEKEVDAIVVTTSGPGMKRAAETFLGGMQSTWAELRLGTHRVKAGDQNGIVQIDLTSLTDKIGELYHTAHPDRNLVLYLLYDDTDHLPPSLLQSLSPPNTETTILHLVPSSATQPRLLPYLAFDVYNRIPRLLHRIEAGGTPLSGAPTYFQYPSFTLAPDKPIKPSLSLSWPLKSYDVLNRWRYVHAAYALDSDTGLVVTLIIDAEGENYVVRTYRTKGMDIRGRLELVWKAFVEFADVAAIEWRMSLTRVGRMEETERQAWKAIIGGAPVTLLMVDLTSSAGQVGPQTQMTVPNIPAPLLTDPASRIVSDTLCCQTATYTHRLPVTLSDAGNETIYPLMSFIINVQISPTGHDRALTKASTATFHVLSHRPAPGKEGEEVDQILSREFQKLEYLGRLRLGIEGGAAGVHVSAVDKVLTGLLAL